jgi:enoyl-CoA hydratase/carnithine racemase
MAWTGGEITTDKLRVIRDGAVIRLIFNRPQKKNALDGDMYRALIAALEAASRDASTRAIVFEGAGGDFTAGNDLADFRDLFQGPGEFPALTFVRMLASFDKPMVAAVTGDAIGVGATLLLHCDLVYAAPQARLRMPFVDLGVVPEAGASLLLPRRIGMARAAQYLLLGESLTGEEAHRLGLVNSLVAPDKVAEAALKAALALAEKPAAALDAARRLMRGDPAELVARIEAEAACFVKALAAPETQARLAAFLTRGKDQPKG